jgi:hypothetical protein
MGHRDEPTRLRSKIFTSRADLVSLLLAEVLEGTLVARLHPHRRHRHPDPVKAVRDLPSERETKKGWQKSASPFSLQFGLHA